jgi:hypothetical protein
MLPVDGAISGWSFELKRPQVGDEPPLVEEMRAGYLDAQTRGLTINDALYQGIYTVTAYRGDDSAGLQAPREKRELPLAVNLYDRDGTAESALLPLTRDQFAQRVAGEDIPISWVGAGDRISLAGATISGQNTWVLLVLAVLVLLLAEILILAWPVLRAAQNPVTATVAAPQPAAS